jgi:hypothetical protein
MYCSLCKRNLSPLEALGMSLLAGVAAVAAVSVVAKAVAPPAQVAVRGVRSGDLAYVPVSREERGLDAAQEYGWGY